jgi:hypothetical protein
MRHLLGSLIPVALAFSLSACGQSVTGTPAYVTIGNAWNDSDALPKASEWCAKWSKVARYRYMEDYRVTFDCVKG